jgi:protein gp37
MSKIEWTDQTANWIVGCTKISAGCAHCYAATSANSARLQQFDQYSKVVDGNGNWNGHIEFVPKVLDDLLKGKKQRRVFTPSMSDPFHPSVKDGWIDRFIATAYVTPHITYQVLTKRPERMYQYFDELDLRRLVPFVREANDKRGDLTDYRWKLPLPNLHLGVSVENQAAADERIPWLLKTPAAKRFLSVEPLLEKVDLSAWMHLRPCPQHLAEKQAGWGHLDCDCQEWRQKHIANGMPSISQVIVGGESGPGARPFHLEWARSLQQQCQAAGTAFFLKQVGGNPFLGGEPLKLKDRKGGDLMELPEDLRIRGVI